MATLKNTSISGNQSLDLPSGTTAQRPSSPANGHTRFNTDYSTVEYYQNGSWYSIDRQVKATAAGTSVYTSQTQDNNTPYTVHTFLSDGFLDVIYGGTIEYMLIGGGGGGGEGSIYDDGGGGGAGGMLIGTTSIQSGIGQSITVGTGGGGATTSNGNKGGDTTAFGLTAFGGGGGAGHRRDAPYASGGGVGVIGSGGGAGGAYGSTDSGDGITRGGSGTPGQGFDGGTNNYRNYLGAGGGGAGQNGSSNHGDGNGGQGGRGRMSTLNGFPSWYAGGGGGYGYNSVRNGGLGGGGKGVFGGVAGYAGGKNSGGGGAGGTSDRGTQSRAKNGGSGIVVVRYKDIKSGIPSDRPDAVRTPNNARLEPVEGLVFELDAGDPGSYNYGKDPRIWYDRYNNVDITLDGTADGTGTEIYSTSHGGAIRFDSNGCFVTQGWPAAIDVDDNTTRRTWEVWAMPTDVGTTHGIFGHKAGSGCSYYCNGGIFIWNGKWAFNWYDNSSYRFLDSGVAAVNGEYAHVVGTFDKDRRPEIYVNGELKAKYGSATNMDYSSGMEIVNIGYNDKDGGQHYFNGEIAICRFYKTTCLREIGVKQNFEAYRGRFGL